MPRSIRNTEGLTLRKLIQNTWHHMNNRYDYKERDVLRSVRIKTVHVYDGKNPGEARTKYIVESRSYPQYYPYYTQKDSRGRPRQYQRSTRHEYDVTLQLDMLSIDTDRFKIRTGSDAPWDFSKKARARRERGRVVESLNVKKGINGDHFFRLSAIRHEAGILYGRNFAKGLPVQTNRNMIQFLTKHELRVLETLIDRGVLK